MPYTANEATPLLRADREALGLSLRTVATRAGVTAMHLSRLERGERGASLAVALALTEALRVAAVEASAAAITYGPDPAAIVPARHWSTVTRTQPNEPAVTR